MKGKYANSAEKRRATEEALARAESAERERDQLTSALADVTRNAARDTAQFRSRISTLEAERDQGASPALATALDAAQQLRREIAALRKVNQQKERSNMMIAQAVESLALLAGFSPQDAITATRGLFSDDDNERRTRRLSSALPPGMSGGAWRRDDNPGPVDDIDRAHGFSELGDSLATFYRALTTDGSWRQEGAALIFDNWFQPGAKAQKGSIA